MGTTFSAAVRSVLVVLLGAAFLPVLALSASGATTDVYVDKTMACSDSGSGTATTPYCTITKGVSVLQPGWTLHIGNGSYAETIKPSVSGTSSAPITITEWSGKSPTVGTGVTNGASIASRSYVTVSNLLFSGTVKEGILVTGSDHISILGNEVTKAGKPVSGSVAPGISLKSTTASLVSRNYTHHNSDSGIFLSNSTTGTTVSYNESNWNARQYQRNANGINVISPGNTLLGNVTHDNEDSGINFYPGGNNNTAVLNVTYNNGDHGIDDLNVTGGRLIGNTVYHNCTTGINVEGTSGSYIVKNNVAVDNAVYPAYNGISCDRRRGNIGIWDSAPASTVVDHNLVHLSKAGTMYVFGSSYTSLSAMQSATGQEKHGIQGDPRFVSASGGNLQLSAGSPAIDRADSSAPSEQSTDILGRPRVDDPSTSNAFAEGPRPYDDIGAYEYQPSGTPTPSAPTARLTVSPTSGTAPLAVTADASGSTDPQGQTLGYTFDWGDSSTATGPQAGATATHTYSTAGTFTVKVTVTNTSGLSSTATGSVTVSGSTTSAPTARLTVSPTSGTAPLAVTADASGSTDPQGQSLSYTFDWGDSSTATGPQAGATATHTYSAAGTFTVKVTVTNTSGLSSTATQSVTVTSSTPPPTTAPAYVNPIANNYGTSTKTSAYITVWRSAGVKAGDLVVLTLQIGATSATGPVSATDDVGNTYNVASSIADGAGNRLVVLSGVARTAIPAGAKITVSYPTATGYRINGEEFSGVTRVDATSSATGTGTSFSSGPVSTAAPAEVVFGAVSIPRGTANPSWSTGWSDLGSYVNGTWYLGHAYRIPTATGSFTATGTASGAWLASIVTFQP